jgi:hypothetical protein
VEIPVQLFLEGWFFFLQNSLTSLTIVHDKLFHISHLSAVTSNQLRLLPTGVGLVGVQGNTSKSAVKIKKEIQ